jgi:hypothetical protein
MNKLIRFDDDHYGFMVNNRFSQEQAHEFGVYFNEFWPGKKLIVMQADEFIDLTGQYEIIPISDIAAIQ